MRETISRNANASANLQLRFIFSAAVAAKPLDNVTEHVTTFPSSSAGCGANTHVFPV